MEPNPKELTLEELIRNLITSDFRGEQFKSRCLVELLRRHYA